MNAVLISLSLVRRGVVFASVAKGCSPMATLFIRSLARSAHVVEVAAHCLC